MYVRIIDNCITIASYNNYHLGQATKGAWRMPWHQKPMKDAISCDKLRVGANSL